MSTYKALPFMPDIAVKVSVVLLYWKSER